MRGGCTHPKGCLSEKVLAEGGKEPWLGRTGSFLAVFPRSGERIVYLAKSAR